MLGTFVAVDVETANDNLDSVCQVGVAVFSDGVLGATWSTLVDPEDYFTARHIGLHGIDPQRVLGAPKVAGIAAELCDRLTHPLVVSHTSFDRIAISRTLAKAARELPQSPWLDSAVMVRRVWPEYSRKGYGLASITSALGIVMTQHHDALSDAVACGEVLLHAGRAGGFSHVDECLAFVRKPLPKESFAQDGDPLGHLVGERIVFTGSLSLVRRDAAALAALAGCEVLDGVTKKTTLLVVGDQDLSKVGEEGKSSKHLKAEALAAAGQPLRIIGQSDFLRLVKQT